VWSAISVGRAELIHIVRYGQFSLFEIAYRSAIIFANLCDDGAGRIKRSQAYDGLDPSEKGAVSYFLGLATAKAFAEMALGVPWLMHLDVYREELAPILSGLSKPDLVGQTAGGAWVTIEAKGRTNTFDQAALTRAKEQAQMLVTIDGKTPALRIGTQTHFGGDLMQFIASDPPAHRRGERIRLPLSRQRLIEAYYRPFRTWLEEDPRAHTTEMAGRIYRAAPIDSADITVGLAPNAGSAELLNADREGAQSDRHYAGRDGVLVILGTAWSTENMTREPQERRRLP
jgi:hypothetical protein